MLVSQGPFRFDVSARDSALLSTTIVLAFIRLKLWQKKKTIVLVCCIMDDVDSRFCIVSKSVTLVTSTVLFDCRGSCPLWNQSRAIALIEQQKTAALKAQSTKNNGVNVLLC